MEQLKLDEILTEPKPEDKPQEAEVDESQNVRQRHKEKEAKAVEEGKKPKEASKEEKPEPKKEEKTAAPQFTDKERAYYASAMDERRKRQALETQLAQLRAARAEPKEEGEKKTFWDDPEAALEAFRNQTLAETRQQSLNTRVNTSELIARSKYQDFDEKVEIFKELMGQNPGLHQQFMGSPDPGEFVYKTAKFHKDLQGAGNIDNLRAQIEKETRIKIEAELKEKEGKLKKEREALPGTLSDARGTKQQAVVWSGPSALDDILKP